MGKAEPHICIYCIYTVYIQGVIPLLNEFIFKGGTESRLGEKNGGIYVSQCSRLIQFLIIGKYVGIACRVVRFKAKTNGK